MADKKSTTKEHWSNAVSVIKNEMNSLDLDPCRLKSFDRTQLPALTKDDVIVASYPNSGCDIVSKMIQTTIANIQSHYGTTETKFHIKTFEDVKKEEYQSTSRNQDETHNHYNIYTTRLRYQHLSKHAHARSCKVIYVVRNPKHAAVQLYTASFFKHMDFKEFVDIFLGPAATEDPYNYKTHFLEYFENDNNLQILFLKYEDLMSHPLETLQRLLSHLGLSMTVESKILQKSFERVVKEDEEQKRSNTTWDVLARSINKMNFMEFFDTDLLARFENELKVDWRLVRTGIV